MNEYRLRFLSQVWFWLFPDRYRYPDDIYQPIDEQERVRTEYLRKRREVDE